MSLLALRHPASVSCHLPLRELLAVSCLLSSPCSRSRPTGRERLCLGRLDLHSSNASQERFAGIVNCLSRKLRENLFFQMPHAVVTIDDGNFLKLPVHVTQPCHAGTTYHFSIR